MNTASVPNHKKFKNFVEIHPFDFYELIQKHGLPESDDDWPFVELGGQLYKLNTRLEPKTTDPCFVRAQAEIRRRIAAC